MYHNTDGNEITMPSVVCRIFYVLIAPNATTYSVTPQIMNPHPTITKWTLINLPERRKRKSLLATYGCFSRSFINAVREAKEQGTLLLNPAIRRQQAFAFAPLWHN